MLKVAIKEKPMPEQKNDFPKLMVGKSLEIGLAVDASRIVILASGDSDLQIGALYIMHGEYTNFEGSITLSNRE